MARKPLIADGEHLPQGDAQKMTELLENRGAGIETAGPEALHTDSVNFEQFMKERVEIAISPKSGAPGEQDVIPVTMNNTLAYLAKGHTYEVPRTVLEVLLRAKTVNFEQVKMAGGAPDEIDLIANMSQSFSFAVRQDTQEGHAWARRILEGAS